MKEHTKTSASIASPDARPTSTLRSARLFTRERGISDTTLWRWEKLGLIRTANILGKKYVVLESLAEFDRRALNGEFSRPPSGAAGASAKAKAEQAGGAHE